MTQDVLKYLQPNAVVPIDMETTSMLVNALRQAIKELESREPDVQETLHWHAFNYRQAHIAQAHEMWEKLEQFVDCKIKASQRTWVGLTDEEIEEAIKSCNTTDTYKYFRAIEAKLKEKNT